MASGWIVVNHFYHSPKFDELHRWLEEAAVQAGLEPSVVTNAQAQLRITAGEKPAWVVFWDKDVSVARLIEAHGVRCFNSAAAIEACDDKFRTYTQLVAHGVAQPETFVVPLRFSQVDWDNEPFVDEVATRCGLPAVVKESFGSFGAQVALVRSRAELVQWLNALGTRDGIVQRFVADSAGRDYRLQVVGEQVVAAIERTAGDGEFRANLTHGGSARTITPSPAQVQLALTATRALGLDFAGVDLLGSPDDPVVCEVNSNAHFVNMARTTGVDIGRDIMEYVRDA